MPITIHRRLAQLIRNLRSDKSSDEKRIAWLENEVKTLRTALSGLVTSGSIGSPNGDAEENVDAMSDRQCGGIPQPIGCGNHPGQCVGGGNIPRGVALTDHQHQGVYSVKAVAGACGGAAPAGTHFVGEVTLSDDFSVIALFDNPGRNADGTVAYVPDRNGGIGAGGGGDPNNEDVICNAELQFVHLPVPPVAAGGTTASPNGTNAAPNCQPFGIPCYNSLGTTEMVRSSNCADIGDQANTGIFLAGGPFLVDCAGHIHSMQRIQLFFYPQSSTVFGDQIQCCEPTYVVTDLRMVCVKNPGDPTRFDFYLDKTVRAISIPEDVWNETDPGTCGEGENKVVTDIIVVDNISCSSACGASITVVKSCISSGGGSGASDGCATGYTGPLVVLCCVQCVAGGLTVKTRTLTVCNGRIIDSATCVVNASGGECS